MRGESVPAWAAAALAQAPLHSEVTVDGCAVHVRTWGPAGAPVVVLVHGGAAHSGWWDHVAPLLTAAHRVVALDLSGHGDSAWRPRYGLAQWAREVLAVGEAAGGKVPPVVVGHSMGGWVAATAGADAGDRLGGIVILDTPTQGGPPEERLREPARPTRVYASRAEALRRFRTLPTQESVLPWVAAHVAEESLREVDEGWTWKFDPGLFGPQDRPAHTLPRPRCRAAYVRAERGLVSQAMADEVAVRLGPGVPVVTLPAAGHHLMLDQPLALVAVVRTLLAGWE